MARMELNEAINAVYDPTVAALRITEGGSATQLFIDYVGGTNPIYIGRGAKGLATASDGWLVQKFTYDGNNNVTQRQTAIGIYDNRASLTYS